MSPTPWRIAITELGVGMFLIVFAGASRDFIDRPIGVVLALGGIASWALALDTLNTRPATAVAATPVPGHAGPDLFGNPPPAVDPDTGEVLGDRIARLEQLVTEQAELMAQVLEEVRARA